MEKEIIKRLCSEEVVIYIANRHKIKPETLITGFLTGDCPTLSILLENEREILHGLMNEIIGLTQSKCAFPPYREKNV